MAAEILTNLQITHWSTRDETILIRCLEHLDNATFSNDTLLKNIPDHTIEECLSRYAMMCARTLRPAEFHALMCLWTQYGSQIFGSYAGACGVSTTVYQRVVIQGLNNEQHSLEDQADFDCTGICDNYDTNRKEIWLCLTQMLRGVSWMQAERTWANNSGDLGQPEVVEPEVFEQGEMQDEAGYYPGSIGFAF